MREKFRARFSRLIPGSVLAAALFSCGLLLWAQRVVEVKGFRAAEPFDPPNEAKMKSLLEGASARPLTNGLTLVRDARLQTYQETGAAEMIVTAPECLHDQTRREVSSSGPLRVRTADDRFLIEGQGFLWQNTNSVLIISNQVHSTVRPEKLENGGVSVTPNPKTSDPGSPAQQDIEIFSDYFEYLQKTGVAMYRGHVRVQGTNLTMSSGVMRVLLPAEKRRLEHITADDNVVMDYETIHALGEHAVYTETNDVMEMTGHPSWRSQEREGRGDLLHIERTNKIFRSIGSAWLRFPAQGGGDNGDFFGGGLTSTNAAASTTNRFLEIFCHDYEFHTNIAFFRENVRMTELVDEQPGGKMNCALMTATFAGTNELQTLLAERDVVFEKEESRLTGARALYTATNGLMEVTGEPAWQSGERQGRGEIVLADLRKGEMQVWTNAWMRVPANEMAEASLTGTNAAPKTTPATNQFATITSLHYTLAKDTAHFMNHVHLEHPRMAWTCEQLDAQMSQTGTREIVAQTNVVFTLLSEKGEKLDGVCQKAVYKYDPKPEGTNDMIWLTGKPVLQTTNGTIRNDVIIVDHAKSKVYAPGKYAMRGTLPPGKKDVIARPRKGR